jgi:hypothetical protein
VANVLSRRWRHLRIDERGRHRIEARQDEAGRRRQENKVASLKREGILAIDHKATATLNHCAEARLAEIGIADAPASGAADALC